MHTIKSSNKEKNAYLKKILMCEIFKRKKYGVSIV